MCDRYVIGEIQGYDVIYIPEKDIVFCKNTAIRLSVLDKAVSDNCIRKWCKSYNLPTRSVDIKKINDINWANV